MELVQPVMRRLSLSKSQAPPDVEALELDAKLDGVDPGSRWERQRAAVPLLTQLELRGRPRVPASG